MHARTTRCNGVLLNSLALPTTHPHPVEHILRKPHAGHVVAPFFGLAPTRRASLHTSPRASSLSVRVHCFAFCVYCCTFPFEQVRYLFIEIATSSTSNTGLFICLSAVVAATAIVCSWMVCKRRRRAQRRAAAVEYVQATSLRSIRCEVMLTERAYTNLQ